MLFERLGPAWQDFQKRVRADVRVLVVDDEPSIRLLLREVLQGEGFAVDSAGSIGEARSLITANEYNLLVIDKNLPDGSGLELIGGVGARYVPSVLITAYPSAETVVEALTHGAADYIAKPFDDVNLVASRLGSVVDRHLSRFLNDRMVKDLTDALAAESADREVVAGIAEQLFAFKRQLAQRPAVLIVEENLPVAEVMRRALSDVRLRAEVATNLAPARMWLERPDGPLTAVVSVEMPEALETVRDLRRIDPLLEVVVTSGSADTEMALAAVDAGAVDYVLRSVEGVDLLQARMQRAVGRARRRRLYVHLVATLYRAAKDAGNTDAERVFSGLGGPDARLSEGAAARPASPSRLSGFSAEEVDLSDLFGGEDELDVAVEQKEDTQPEVVVHPAQPGDESLPLVEGEAIDAADRREERRLEASLEVRFQPTDPPGSVAYSHLKDISSGGMFIQMDEPLATGTHLDIEVMLGWGTDPVRVEGEVVRSVAPGREHLRYAGVGVRLIGPGREELRRLVEELARRVVPG